MSWRAIAGRVRRPFLCFVSIALAAGVASCEPPGHGSLGPEDADVRLAGKPPDDPPILVDDFDPKEGALGQRIALAVLGDGFEDGATVFLGRNGKPVKSITTHSTIVHSSTSLTGDIEIGLDADVGDYEVVVSFRRGKGIGTELFHVKEPVPGQGGEVVTIDLSGDATATDQAAEITVESASKLLIQGISGFVDQLSFFAAAGFPTIGSLGGCVTNPPDLETADPASLQRLIDRLEDVSQVRGIAIQIDRKKLGQASRNNGINHTWNDDADGHQIRTRVIDSDLRDRRDFVTVTEGPVDVFTFTGGSVVSWDTSTDQAIACPNGGSVVVTVNR